MPFKRAPRRSIPLFLRVRLDTHKRRKRFEPDNEEAEANQAFWRLPDVMAWVMWRDLSIIQELAEREKTTQNTLAAASALDGLSGVKMAISRPGDAFKKISIAAQHCQIVVRGEEPESGKLKEIPAIEWRRLKLSERLDALLLPNGREAFREPLFDRASVMGRWPERTSSASHGSTEMPKAIRSIPAKRRGPPDRYNWPRFDAALADLISQEGIPDPALDPNWNQARVESRMADWCAAPKNSFGGVPSEATIRRRVSTYLEQFKKGS